MKIISDFVIIRKLIRSHVCLETGWTDLLSKERSLRNSILEEITIIVLCVRPFNYFPIVCQFAIYIIFINMSKLCKPSCRQCTLQVETNLVALFRFSCILKSSKLQYSETEFAKKLRIGNFIPALNLTLVFYIFSIFLNSGFNWKSNLLKITREKILSLHF